MDKVFDPNAYADSIDTAYATMAQLQAQVGGGISRFGAVDGKGKLLFSDSTVCFAEFGRKKYIANEAFVFACYNRPRNDREAQSRRWLEFLLHPDESPWKSIFPYFVSIDPDVVESTGFIVYTGTDCPGNLLYNFFIASRTAYEYPAKIDSWINLQDMFHLSPLFAAAVTTGFLVDIKPQRILVREEGYRKQGRAYIRDEWGDKKYFPPEYEYKIPDNIDPAKVQFRRCGGDNHTFYSGIDGCYGIGNASPRVLQASGTFRDRKYGWQAGQASWDIWTHPNADKQRGRYGERQEPPDYDKLPLDFKSVIDYCNKLIGDNK